MFATRLSLVRLSRWLPSVSPGLCTVVSSQPSGNPEDSMVSLMTSASNMRLSITPVCSEVRLAANWKYRTSSTTRNRDETITSGIHTWPLIEIDGTPLFPDCVAPEERGAGDIGHRRCVRDVPHASHRVAVGDAQRVASPVYLAGQGEISRLAVPTREASEISSRSPLTTYRSS